MKILVTGARGQLGSELVRYLQHTAHECVGVGMAGGAGAIFGRDGKRIKYVADFGRR